MAEALSQIPGKGSGSGAHLRASSLPADAQGRVRFAHRTLSLHATLPEVPVWDKRKLGRACAEAVEFVRFLWKWMEKREEIHSLHRGEVSFACGKPKNKINAAEDAEKAQALIGRHPQRPLCSLRFSVET